MIIEKTFCGAGFRYHCEDEGGGGNGGGNTDGATEGTGIVVGFAAGELGPKPGGGAFVVFAGIAFMGGGNL